MTCLSAIHVPTNFQMYRQNSKKALLGGGEGQLPPPPLWLRKCIFVIYESSPLNRRLQLTCLYHIGLHIYPSSPLKFGACNLHGYRHARPLNYLSHCSSGPQYELICIQPIRDRAYSFAYSQSTAGDSTLYRYKLVRPPLLPSTARGAVGKATCSTALHCLFSGCEFKSSC